MQLQAQLAVCRLHLHACVYYLMKPKVFVQVLLCIFLFSVALFITTVIAKLLASYFHKQAFFDKMQATLTQVR